MKRVFAALAITAFATASFAEGTQPAAGSTPPAPAPAGAGGATTAVSTTAGGMTAATGAAIVGGVAIVGAAISLNNSSGSSGTVKPAAK